MPTDNDTITHLLAPEECDPYSPKAALIVFRKSNSSATYLELRAIRRDGSMGPAKPVSKEFIQSMLSSFSEEYRNVPHGPVPENMLYIDTRRGKNIYMWYNPPMRRNRFFSSGLGLEDGVYHVPGTLYLVNDGSLYVWCFEGKKPKMDRILLGVPYFHVYKEGRVCMGNARVEIPDKENLSYQDVMNAWEKAFWNSVDVHTGGSPSTKSNLIETIRRYKDKPFDTKALEIRKDGLTPDGIIRKIK